MSIAQAKETTIGFIGLGHMGGNMGRMETVQTETGA